MSAARHHAEWLNLVPASGPFLSMKVLLDVFPEGLDKRADDSDLRANLRLAHEEWLDDQGGLKPDEAIHQAWIRFVLREALELDDEVLVEGQALPEWLTVRVPEHGETLRPALAAVAPKGRDDAGAIRLLIQVVPSGQNLDGALRSGRWKASPATRMMTLLHGASAAKSPVKLGLVTNGDHWMLVHAIAGETTTYASFYASLFSEEPLTLRAFTSLLSSHRFFGVPHEDQSKSADDEKGQTLEALFKRSAKNQADVTDQLGYQVRRAVEQLIQSIDRVDRDRGRELLEGFDEKRLYEAAVTVMMRLVFLLAAEERKLLPLGQPLYDQHYAVSTLLAQLQEVADRHGQEVLSRRYDAWSRLLASFRAVHDGVRHEDLKLPAYGGSLFDADRYPFLEGRPADSKWKETAARPLAIDNLTVLDVLRSIQVLEVKVPGGGPAEARRLSFRALGVEQIGHVYEGLLDHTAKRAKGPVVSLRGTKDKEPEVEVEELDDIRAASEAKFVDWLKKETGRSKSALKKAVEYQLPREDHRRWMLACENKEELYERVKPYAGLVRDDVHGKPVVFDGGAVYVTEGIERRATGTHYTPRSLTEPIVQYTLEPLVYEGPAEGWDKEKWKLRTAKEVLDLKVCDMAMGSGAFLVQACRYMAERVVEAWEEAETKANGRLVITPNGELAEGDPSERHVPTDPEERLAIARRLVADRCLYGVDKNPMAVEMAKLSLWLVTLQKDKPFTFVDHSLRCGDSLLGLTSIEQLTSFHLDPKRGKKLHATLVGFTSGIEESVRRAQELREKIASFAVNGIDDARKKAWLLGEAERELANLRAVGNLVVAAALDAGGRRGRPFDDELQRLSQKLPRLLAERPTKGPDLATPVTLGGGPRPKGLDENCPFHWAQEFPEVFARDGFDAIVGNPPFLGNKYWASKVGIWLQSMAEWILDRPAGKSNLACLFHRRAANVLNANGCLGLLGPEAIREGDSLDVGLQPMSETGTIYRADSSRPWPGDATIHVCTFWWSHREFAGARVLDAQTVPTISPSLRLEEEPQPQPLKGFLWCQKGIDNSKGAALIIDESSDHRALLEVPPSLLRRYITSKDITAYGLGPPVRSFLDTGERSLEEISERYHESHAFLLEKVAPTRTEERLKSYRGLAQRWWQPWCPRFELFSRVRRADSCFVVPMVAKYVLAVRVPSEWAFTNKLIVFPDEREDLGVLLRSAAWEWWVRKYSGLLNQDLSVSLTKAIATFAAPTKPVFGSASLTKRYEAIVAELLAEGAGYTRIYNRYHDARESSAGIRALRQLHRDVDLAVNAAYAWENLELDHGFHPTKDGTRHTISPAARAEVMRRLLLLNGERYEEELRRGLHKKKRRRGTKARRTKARSAVRPPSERQVRPQIGFDFAAKTDSLSSLSSELSADAAALLEAVRNYSGAAGKSALLDASGVSNGKWTSAIRELKERGLVEQVGQRRGARYTAKEGA